MTDGGEMRKLRLNVDGVAVDGSPDGLASESQVLVPIESFSDALGAELKELGGSDAFAICLDERCVPIDAESLRTIDGNGYADLASFGEALGLSYAISDHELRVSTSESMHSDGSVGHVAPTFTLPDMRTGEPVLTDFARGRKTVFYVWASW
jgi:hypothetical protein